MYVSSFNSLSIYFVYPSRLAKISNMKGIIFELITKDKIINTTPKKFEILKFKKKYKGNIVIAVVCIEVANNIYMKYFLRLRSSMKVIAYKTIATANICLEMLKD